MKFKFTLLMIGMVLAATDSTTSSSTTSSIITTTTTIPTTTTVLKTSASTTTTTITTTLQLQATTTLLSSIVTSEAKKTSITITSSTTKRTETSPANTETTQEKIQDSGISPAAIIGFIIGGIFVVILLVVLTVYYCYRLRQASMHDKDFKEITRSIPLRAPDSAASTTPMLNSPYHPHDNPTSQYSQIPVNKSQNYSTLTNAKVENPNDNESTSSPVKDEYDTIKRLLSRISEDDQDVGISTVKEGTEAQQEIQTLKKEEKVEDYTQMHTLEIKKD
ncbi:hypothetical protein BC833DRAFT_593920 [Globomyces pollinis-pini]|nr:hypothetical protein BC833DRAFT_593920 [Globomyces pollinis-pini]